MKKLILAGIFIIGVGLGYAYAENKATIELSHLEIAEYSMVDNMSVLKVIGKYKNRSN